MSSKHSKQSKIPKRSPLSGQSKMFNSIVLMGSGLALGCGGIASVDGNGSSGGSSTSHGGNGAGGVSAVGAGGGGAPSFAGNISGILNTGGSLSAAGGSGFVNPLPCPPSQWTCTPLPNTCAFDFGVALGSSCRCDLSRPAVASDCKPGLSFVCIEASADAEGHLLTPPLPLQCSCQPTPPVSCTTACDVAYGNGTFSCDFADVSSILCGCAAPIILK